MSDQKICEDCGKDHNEVLRETFPEFLMLRRAYEEVLTNREPSELGIAMERFTMRAAQENTVPVLHDARENGQPAVEATIELVAAMMKLGIAMGVMASRFYGDRFGFVELPSQEEADEEYEKAESARKEAEAKREGLIEVLRAAGLQIPEDFDGVVIPIDPSKLPKEALAQLGVRESASEERESSTPGFYL